MHAAASSERAAAAADGRGGRCGNPEGDARMRGSKSRIWPS